MKRALIVGCKGQDGRLLYDFLLQKRYVLVGIDKNDVRSSRSMHLEPVNIEKYKEVSILINKFKPDEIYYLAAFHNASEDIPIEDIDMFKCSYKVNVLSLVNFLDAIKNLSPKTRLFYAASSHIFGEDTKGIQNENTPVNPSCIYGITKAAGLFSCRFYRKKYSIFASTGILYNHESSLRRANFVSRKIIKGAINIKRGKQDNLVLGDLAAKIDWGYAPDYIDAMYRILNIKAPEDFIIATGKGHTVSDFVKTVFGYLGINWKLYVREDTSIIKKKNFYRIGSPKKIMSATGWRSSVDFKEMIKLLLAEEGAFNG